MLFNGFLHTGTRMICWNDTQTIDLWKTDTNVEIILSEGKRILLDEDESLFLRRWAELSTQTAVVDAQHDLLRKRCELQEMTVYAAKLNRQASRTRTPAAKKPTKAAQPPAGMVDINVWKAARRAAPSLAETCLDSAT